MNNLKIVNLKTEYKLKFVTAKSASDYIDLAKNIMQNLNDERWASSILKFAVFKSKDNCDYGELKQTALEILNEPELSKVILQMRINKKQKKENKMTKESDCQAWKKAKNSTKKEHIEKDKLFTLPDYIEIPNDIEIRRDKLKEIVLFISEFETISTATIMRHFGYGYCKAVKISDYLESLGFIRYYNPTSIYRVLG